MSASLLFVLEAIKFLGDLKWGSCQKLVKLLPNERPYPI
jgi:hypothetical protein